VLPIRLDEELNECKTKRLGVRRVPFHTLGVTDATKAFDISHPRRDNACPRHLASEVLLVGCRPLLDKYERRSVMMFDGQTVNDCANCPKCRIGVRGFEGGVCSSCQGEIT
jgi:hypothetical protein